MPLPRIFFITFQSRNAYFGAFPGPSEHTIDEKIGTMPLRAVSKNEKKENGEASVGYFHWLAVCTAVPDA